MKLRKERSKLEKKKKRKKQGGKKRDQQRIGRTKAIEIPPRTDNEDNGC